MSRPEHPGWISPAGLGAIAALITAIVGGLAVLLNSGEEGTRKGSGRAETTTESAALKSSVPPAFVDRDVEGVAQLSALIDEIAARELNLARSIGTFAELADDKGKVSVEVPVKWHDQEVANWLDDDDSPIGLALSAAEDISRFFNSWGAAGVFLGVGDRVPGGASPKDRVMSQRRRLRGDCVAAAGGGVQGRTASGLYSVWTRCGSADSMAVVYATSNDEQYETVALFQLVDRSEVKAADRVLRTVQVEPPVGIAGQDPVDNNDLPGKLIP